jgi:glutathione S-transferase
MLKIAITRAHNLLKVMEVELGKTSILPAASRPSPTCRLQLYRPCAEGNGAGRLRQRACLAGAVEALPGFVGMPRTVAGLQKTA